MSKSTVLPSAQAEVKVQRTKFQAVAGSKNAFAAIVTLIFGFFAVNGIKVDTSQVTGVIDAINSGNISLILPILVVNFLNPITTIVKNGGPDWKGMLNSPNFWTQVITTVLSVFAIFGLVIPEEALTGFLDAVIGKNASFIEIVIAFVIHLGNFVFHLFFDDDDEKAVIEDKEIEVIETTKTSPNPKKLTPSIKEA